MTLTPEQLIERTKEVTPTVGDTKTVHVPSAVVKPDPAAPKSEIIKYLEEKVAEQQTIINRQAELLFLYRDHAVALAELTTQIFVPIEQPEEKTDA